MNNGKQIRHVECTWMARLIDGDNRSTCRVRLTAMAESPDGPREIACCELEVFEGGPEMIREMMPHVVTLVRELVADKIGIITRS